MKLVGVLAVALAPLGSALVIPNVDMNAALESISVNRPTWLDVRVVHASHEDDSVASPSASSSVASVNLHDLEEDSLHALKEASSFFETVIDDANDFVSDLSRYLHPPHLPPPDHDHPPTDEFTIWQLLEKSEHGKTFTNLVSEFKSLVDILNSTSHNYTLFIPSERAFEHIPSDHKKPTGEELEKFLRYHIVEGGFDAKQIWFKNTLPTLLEEELLGDEQQRIRVRVGLRGVTVNGYSHVVMGNIRAKNGVIHTVDHILVPPVMVGKGLSLFPSIFSTLLHAYAKTDFVSYIHSVPMEGSTVFAPSNRAFAKLGPRVNAYLFETEHGRKILKAILKYQIVANTTLYSDAVYRKLADGDDVDKTGGRNTHYELKTLYEDKGLGVDIWRWAGWTSIKVNGHVLVVFADGVAKNGVVHVVDSVPLPPCPRRGHDHEGDASQVEAEGEMSIEELEDCFRALIDEEDDVVDDEWKHVPEHDQFVFADL